ncbi:MAG: SPOR domain-containing protein [Bacteroidales bacterium]|nr:SPOR domain-containing protein [Bacteroidales bacterium]
MEISQHIKNLLKSNERVILAGFGTFMSKHISAKYDAETKTMKPPVKIAVFDENIKEDAGLLAKHMAEQEGISLDNAKEQIQEYVKMINAKLSSNQTVEFKDLGKFSKKPDGKLDFSFLSEDNLLLDSFGLPTVSLGEKSINTSVTSPPVSKKTVKEKVVIKEKPVKQKTVKQKVVKKQTKVKSTDGKPKKKRKGLLIFLIFIGAVALMLTAVYFFKPDLWKKGYSFSTEKLTVVKSKISNLFGGNDKENYDIIEPEENNDVIDTSAVITENINNNEDGIVDEGADSEENTSENNEVVEDNTATEEVIVNNETQEEAVVEEVVTNTNISPAQGGKYYIIVGSVKTETSAKKEQKRFSNKGISTSIIHVPSKGRYRISAGEYNSVKEAQNAYAEIQSKHGNIEAWVWEKR